MLDITYRVCLAVKRLNVGKTQIETAPVTVDGWLGQEGSAMSSGAPAPTPAVVLTEMHWLHWK